MGWLTFFGVFFGSAVVNPAVGLMLMFQEKLSIGKFCLYGMRREDLSDASDQPDTAHVPPCVRGPLRWRRFPPFLTSSCLPRFHVGLTAVLQFVLTLLGILIVAATYEVYPDVFKGAWARSHRAGRAPPWCNGSAGSRPNPASLLSQASSRRARRRPTEAACTSSPPSLL